MLHFASCPCCVFIRGLCSDLSGCVKKSQENQTISACFLVDRKLCEYCVSERDKNTSELGSLGWGISYLIVLIQY